MKQIACNQMGGPADCTTMISGATAQQLVQNGMAHVTQAHPQMAEDIKKMTPEETSKWMDDFQKKFDALPEM